MIFTENRSINLRAVLRRIPNATAQLRGSEEYSDIKGEVRFYQTNLGTIVAAEVNGLPSPESLCASPVFGFHIHGGGSCTGNQADPFADALTHYDPYNCPHPYHAGDMPPLFPSRGYAFSLFITDRFTVREIIGKTVMIHSMPDDFTTQPSGNAGSKIACGEIVPTLR